MYDTLPEQIRRSNRAGESMAWARANGWTEADLVALLSDDFPGLTPDGVCALLSHADRIAEWPNMFDEDRASKTPALDATQTRERLRAQYMVADGRVVERG